MLQMSKLLRSRSIWRRKASERAEEVRELKKTKRRYQVKIAELKAQIAELKQYNKKTKYKPSLVNKIRALCIQLALQGVVSYQSIPRILRVFNFSKIQYNNWVPHFSSVINWLLRLGLGKLQRVKPIKQPWIAIIDHSIDVGVKKVLVILRVSLDILSEKKCAIKLQDCECIGLKVAETVNGQSIATELDGIFNVAGVPSAILKDCDRTLNKGVELWKTKHQLNTPIIEDISHVMAAAIKKQFENTEYYRKFTQFISYGAKKLRQTPLSFLAPPKLRTKGRFLSIGRLGHWSEKC